MSLFVCFCQLKQKIRREVLAENLQRVDENQSGHIEYGLGKGALIPKLYGRTIDKWRNKRLVDEQ